MGYKKLLGAVFGVRPEGIKEPDNEIVESILNTLDEREVFVLISRFERGMDYRAIGQRCARADGSEVGITGTRARMILKKALRRLRHPSRRNLLKGYIAR